MFSSNFLPAVLHHVDAARSGSKIPKPDCFILRSGREYGPTPGAQREDVSSVSGVGLPDRVGCRIAAIGDVNSTVAGSARD